MAKFGFIGGLIYLSLIVNSTEEFSYAKISEVETEIGSDDSVSVFYFCIGSEHYIKDDVGISYTPLPDAKGAGLSSRLVAGFLREQFGAIGIEVSSSAADSSLISMETFREGIYLLDDIIQRSGKKNPLVIIYYCGHGSFIQESNDRLILPGTYGSLPEEYQEWTEVIPISPVCQFFEKQGYNYLFLLDCCYNTETGIPSAAMMDSTFWSENLELNSNLKGPIINAVPVGADARTYINPLDSFGIETIGPICKGVLSGFGMRKRESYSLNSFVKRILLFSIGNGFDDPYYSSWSYPSIGDSCTLSYNPVGFSNELIKGLLKQD